MAGPPGASAGPELRQQLLRAPPEAHGFTPSREFPRVYGVITDWNLGEAVASIVALRSGAASLYTDAAFGILGGEAHEAVRLAAVRAVRLAARYVAASEPVDAFPYPPPGRVLFYLLTHEGVRRLEGDEARIAASADPTAPLFAAAQDVLTALRRVVEPEDLSQAPQDAD